MMVHSFDKGGLMNIRFIVSGVVMAIASLMAGFIVHATLLHADYAALSSVFRSDVEGMNYFHWMLLAHYLDLSARHTGRPIRIESGSSFWRRYCLLNDNTDLPDLFSRIKNTRRTCSQTNAV
jgi:hypothetical protein